jgi:putative transposase
MPRAKRKCPGGFVYHLLNRSNGRVRMFHKEEDFAAFERILAEGVQRYSIRLAGYCLMSNHWHLLVWPRGDDEVSAFLHWVTLTHTQRWHAAHKTAGMGHLYQGRFKSFPVQSDGHYLTVLRYIEQNPLRAEIVKRSVDWPWSSLACRRGINKELRVVPGPVPLPANWLGLVDILPNEPDLRKLENCILRGCPIGEEDWVRKTAEKLDLDLTLRSRGRPRKQTRAEKGS